MWQHKICGVPAKENYPLSVVPKSEDESVEYQQRKTIPCRWYPKVKMNQTKTLVAFPLYLSVIDTHLDSQTTLDRYIQFSIRENKYDFHGF